MREQASNINGGIDAHHPNLNGYRSKPQRWQKHVSIPACPDELPASELLQLIKQNRIKPIGVAVQETILISDPSRLMQLRTNHGNTSTVLATRAHWSC